LNGLSVATLSVRRVVADLRDQLKSTIVESTVDVPHSIQGLDEGTEQRSPRSKQIHRSYAGKP
jgi:hypothetical protein